MRELLHSGHFMGGCTGRSERADFLLSLEPAFLPSMVPSADSTVEAAIAQGPSCRCSLLEEEFVSDVFAHFYVSLGTAET